MQEPLPISIEHRDIGATIATDIFLGQTLVMSYTPGTRHIETAQQIAESVLAKALGALLVPQLLAEQITHADADSPIEGDQPSEGDFDFETTFPSWAKRS